MTSRDRRLILSRDCAHPVLQNYDVIILRLFLAMFLTLGAMSIRLQSASFSLDQNTEIHATSVAEALELLLTGTFEHTHEHDEDSHDTEQSHQHGFVAFSTSPVFIHTAYSYSLLIGESDWGRNSTRPALRTFRSEILRPPIAKS